MITMTTLFWDYFQVTISASLVIGLILLMRLFTRKVPKTIVCVLWAIVFVRLLLPFQIENPFSLQADTSAVLRHEVQYAAEEQAIIHLVELPQHSEPVYTPVRIDYSSIAGLVWLIGVSAMALYMVISYLRLRHSLRNAVVKESDVFVAPGINTAFLFGYFRPRIYLPLGLEEQSSAMVTTHERAHLKRGDGWLKLLGFIALTVHWYNPFVWLAYILLCKDMEIACDEYVIRNMQETERKAYASALLACNRRSGKLLGSPVAFAEDNVKKRIKHVLDYRKPALWISITAIIVVLLVSVFALPDATGNQHPEYYDDLISMLGQPIDAVCAELEISREELIEEDTSAFKTPLKAEYAGVQFDLWLYTIRGTDTFASFQYFNVYEGQREQAVKDTVAVAHHMFTKLGKGTLASKNKDFDPDRLKNATEESVDKLFDNERYRSIGTSTLGDKWDLTDSGDGNIKTYLQELVQTEVWQGAYGNKDMVPTYEVEFTAWNDHLEDRAIVAILYNNGFQYDANENNIFYATHMDPPSLWDKFLNWMN